MVCRGSSPRPRMSNSALLQNQQLRDRLALLVEQSYRYDNYSSLSTLGRASEASCENSSGPFDLIITSNEVNRRHGTGVLLKNIFAKQSRFISVRARDDYNGDHDFGLRSFSLSHRELSRVAMFRAL